MDTALKETQTRFYALDMSHVGDDFKVDDGFNIKSLRVKEADKDGSLNGIAPTYDPYDQVIRDGIYEGGRLFPSVCCNKAFSHFRNITDVSEVWF